MKDDTSRSHPFRDSVADVAALAAKGATSLRFNRGGQRTECGVTATGQFGCRS